MRGCGTPGAAGAPPPRRPREDGFTHPTDNSKFNLAPALSVFRVAAFKPLVVNPKPNDLLGGAYTDRRRKMLSPP